MKKKLKNSLKKDEKLFNLIFKNQNKIIIKKFVFNVQISKTKYIQMIKIDISLLYLILRITNK